MAPILAFIWLATWKALCLQSVLLVHAMREQPLFLPLSQEDGKRLDIEQFDVILVSGDAYVDHPSFGAAVIGRSLWDAGYSVGIIDQPDWRRNEDFLRLGSPRLFFGVTSGNVDSMVNNFTPNLKRRSSDVYSPGGTLRRPDRAAIVYADRLHALFPGVPIVLGGIEASLRRFAHYDYWSDSVRRSILADAPADLLVYGMGERALKEVALRLVKGEAVSDIRDVAGTTYKDEVRAWKSGEGKGREESVLLPDFGTVSSDKRKYAQAFALHYQEQDPFSGKAVVQVHPKTVIIQNPPARPLASEELDHKRGPSLLSAAHSRFGAGKVLNHQPSWLFRIMLLLCSYSPPGANRAEPQH